MIRECDLHSQKERKTNASSSDFLSARLCPKGGGRKVGMWCLEASGQWQEGVA